MPVWEKTLMVGIRPYTVAMLTKDEFDEKHAEGQAEAGGSWWGLHTESQLTIDLRSDTENGPMHPLLSAMTMLHEALHAIWRQAGLDAWDNDRMEERIIMGLAPALVELFHRNPWLVPYLLNPQEMPPPDDDEDEDDTQAVEALKRLREEMSDDNWFECEPVLRIRRLIAEGLGE